MRRWILGGVWIGGIAAVLTIGVLLNGLVKPPPEQVYTSHGVVDLPGYSSNGTLEKPSATDVAQVKAALAVRARAVLDGDRAAFMGVVDDARPAAVAAQRTAWQNTRQLDFERLSYTYDGVVEPDTPLSTPSFLAQVTTTYQLRGFDTSPIQVDDGFTFVKNHGRWQLAGMNGADSQFNSATLPVPWEGAAISTYGDSSYLAIVDRGRGDLGRHIVALCHAASAASAALLGTTEEVPTVVLATSHARGFKRFTGPDALAVTYPLKTVDGRESGWRLVLNPAYVDRVVDDPVVLTHELTHLATQTYLPYLPAWLAEGTAEYVGWHAHGGLAAQAGARGYSSARVLPGLLPISSNFYLQHVEDNYVEGMALVTWIEEHRGASAVLALMRAYADAGAGNPSYDPDLASPRVLRTTIGLTSEALARAAYDELNATVGH
jgi:hypothetical protein